MTMLRVTQLKLPPWEGEDALERLIRQTLHLRTETVFSYEILRRSIDARKKPNLSVIYSVLIRMQDPEEENRILKRHPKNVEAYAPVRYCYTASSLKRVSAQDAASAQKRVSDQDAASDQKRVSDLYAASDQKMIPKQERVPRKLPADFQRPVIIGTGPAGLFCGLLLAREGLCPILIERGQRAKERTKTVHSFWNGAPLDLQSNVQFGEGGAGTFSDGKLNTGVKDPDGRIRFVLETFVQAGADPDILYDAKPHVGTDVLKDVVTALTDEICQRGGEVCFETQMVHLSSDSHGIWKVSCRKRLRDSSGGSRKDESLYFFTRHVVLAIGHSSRDTFSMLQKERIVMHPKAFAVGVRIQHPQEVIDHALYGDYTKSSLPAASYKLTHRLPDQRGVYSFCMCPGGYVVNASSEDGCLAVNGMSNHGRDSGIANSAIVVTVSPEEIASYLKESDADDSMGRSGPGQKSLTGTMQDTLTAIEQDALIGMEFQRKLERMAYQAGNGMIPVQRFGDFVKNNPDSSLSLPAFAPGIRGKFQMADIRRIFPSPIRQGIEEGILAWERQIEGFSSEEALLCAAESRTSSPVRIDRGDDFQALSHPGLYPCGEGAGYAGGITSAAVDGLKVAEQILRGVS